MMDARELAQVRSDVEAVALPDTAVLSSLVQVSDGEGGLIDTWTAYGTVPCRLDNLSGSRKPIADAIQAFNSWILTVPHNTDIGPDTRVFVNDYTFSVSAVSDVGSWHIVRRAALEWID
jgi:SPP1 family predicted phage head-tail adaptor